MKYKLSIGIFAVLVSTLMLMSNVLGSAGPPVWINQAMLSAPADAFTSQDPENSGFGPIQVVVWEEFSPITLTWDIYMKYSLLDGALLSWIFPILHPATAADTDEINPAVTVTNTITGSTEIHVVYQIWNLAGGQWDVEHTWTNNFGGAWSVPVVLDVVPANDATDPAIVFTEDLNFPGALSGMLVQFVWSEANALGSYEIQYEAYYFDPSVFPPVRGYVGPTLIQSVPGENCLFPEIASVDERLNPAAYDYYFSVVWQESVNLPPLQWNVWYHDGTTTISPGAPATVLTPGSLGQLNPVNNIGHSYHPDISASQDYAIAGGAEAYYFHVNWVFNILVPASWQIDSCYYVGPLTTPGAAAFVVTAPARGPGAIVLDNPTIATKMVMLLGGITVFETWMCWEDSSVAASVPDIWYRVGQCPTAGPPFAYTVAAAIVPYIQGLTSEFNPELWNRNDSFRMFPPLTHLVFDMTRGAAQEVEYIDP